MKSFIFLLLLSLPVSKSYGQRAESRTKRAYAFRQYTDQNGLPQNSVKSIAKDHEGYIWLATENGLVRFDGTHFFTFNQSNSPISSNRIYAIQPSLEKPFDKFYAWNETSDVVEIKNGKIKLESRDGKGTTSVFFHPDMDHKGVYVTVGAPNMFKKFFEPHTYIIPIPGKAEGNYYICKEGKLTYFENWKQQDTFHYNYPSLWTLFRMSRTLYHHNGDGTFDRIHSGDKTGAKGGLLKKIKLSGDIVLQKSRGNGNRLENLMLYWNNVSDQVFLSSGQSLYLLRETAGGQLTTTLLFEGFDFTTNVVNSVYYDKEANRVFLGSHIKGLYVVTVNNFRTLERSTADVDNVFYAQGVYDSSTVVTSKGVLMGLDPVRKTSKKPGFLPAHPLMENLDPFGMHLTDERHIWSYYGNYIYCIDSKNKKPRKTWKIDVEISQVYQAPDGVVWIGTRRKGLFRLKPWETSSMPELFTDEYLKKLEIKVLSEFTGNTLLAGTNKGVYKINLQTKKVTILPGTETFYVRSLYIPPHSGGDNVWITTYGNGFSLFHKNRLTSFPMDKDRYLSTSHCIVEDKNGYFWIPSNKGLFQVSKEELISYARDPTAGNIFYMYYTSEQGFNTNEFNGGCQPCAVRLPGGYVSLPSLSGLVWFVPEKILPELPDKPILAERLELNGRDIPFSGDTIRIPHDFRQVRFYVTTPYFGHANNLNFSYSISEGERTAYNNEWITIDAMDPVIYIPSLGPGIYTINVRKTNGFGRDNHIYKKITLSIEPAWHQTWKFYGILTALIIGLSLWILTTVMNEIQTA